MLDQLDETVVDTHSNLRVQGCYPEQPKQKPLEPQLPNSRFERM